MVDKDHSSTRRCLEHSCELDYYCGSCEVLLCVCCALTRHSGHHYGTVDQMTAKQSDEMKQMNVALEVIAKAITVAHEDVDKLIRNQSDEFDKIDQHYDEQVRKLMEQKEQAKAQIREQMAKKEAAFVAQQTEIEVIQKEVQSIIKLSEMLEKSSGKDISAEVKKQKQVIGECIRQVDAKWRKISSQLTQTGNISVPAVELTPFKQSVFNPANCELLFPNNLYIGTSVIATLCMKDSQGNLCVHCGKNDVHMEIVALTGKVVHATNVQDNYDGSYKVTFTPKHIGKAKLMVSINGQQVKGSPYDVTVYRSYTHVGVEKLNASALGGDSKQLWGIAIGRHGIWAVTDHINHCVYLFSINMQGHGRYYQVLKKVGSHGSADGQFQHPCGIVFDANNNLFVVDGNNHRIQEFDMGGKYLLQFGSKGARPGQLSSPRGITLHNDRLYIADSGNKRVSVFQTTGQFCHTIGEQLLGIPCDVTVTNNALLVAVYGLNCVYAFTLDGQSKGHFCTLHMPDRQTGVQHGYQQSNITNSNMYPFSITADLNGFVVVSETCNQCIEIFDQDGTYVNSIIVKEVEHRMTVYSADSAKVKKYHHYPLGVVVSPEGVVWVTSADRSDIQQIVQEAFPIH